MNKIFNTPYLVGAYKSYVPNLLHIYLILGSLRDLVKTFVNWLLKLTELLVIFLIRSFLDEMTIYLNVLDLFMENQVTSNRKSYLIIID